MNMYNAVPLPNWPGKLGLKIITKAICEKDDYLIFQNQVAEATGEGYTIENCGINGSVGEKHVAWAILGANVIEGEPPKEE